MSSHVCTGAPTVDVDIALLHELAEVRQPLGRVYLGHVDGTQGSRSVEGSDSERWRPCGYICSSCRVGAP